MTNEIFEKELQGFDYSVFSKVKDSLLDELLQKHRQDNFGKFQKFSAGIFDERMTDEELDYVAAAGNPAIQKNPKDENKIF
ncbi:MAG: hypothetical protein IK062_06235 [Selenomonadaceae bacterium]|nr:hypothetical protein [Selenomonadaceae bacterium]